MKKDLQTIDMEFKFRRIHIGLGKIQSIIIQILEKQVRTWQWMLNVEGRMGIEDLTSKVYYPDIRGATMWMGDEYPITRSQINTVWRAARALEKRGLVTTMITEVEELKGMIYLKSVGIPTDKH